jgi:DNA repair exonuclease SbcCD ATPase subunit
MNHKNVLKEEVDQIMKQAFWSKSGVSLNESVDTQEAQEVVETPVEVEAEVEQVTEETHSCPLCESTLEESISDEKLTEHIEMMLGIINEMNDVTDEELEAIEEEIDEVDDEQAEVVEEKSEMPAFLKSKMKGKKGMKAEKPKASC